MAARQILPGATLGVMGGGQLGRMFAHAAQQMGYFTAVLDPDPQSPAGLVSHHHIRTAFDDDKGLAQLARRCAAITTEFENVPAQALRTLAAKRPVAPGADAVAVAQDRAAEKAHFARCGVPCAPHALIESDADVEAVDAALLPGILKTARLGYDGKGQVRVRSHDELRAAFAQLHRVPCVLERMLPLAGEISVVVARAHDGAMVHLPVQSNLHRDGILAVTEVHAQAVPAPQAQQAIEAARAIAQGLSYVGVLCVEFFVLDDGALVVNEMAPRPHNSGHYSMDACDLSQFELQVRAMTGLPLVQPRQHSAAIMLNLLGDLWFRDGDAQAMVPAWDRVLALPGTRLHLYGKAEARRGRKMGHLNIVGADAPTVRSIALQAVQLLGIAPF
jgi:5-(carboxyamino)imidazole ribonucleotide synthase